jgi:hypothetical protein
MIYNIFRLLLIKNFRGEQPIILYCLQDKITKQGHQQQKFHQDYPNQKKEVSLQLYTSLIFYNKNKILIAPANIGPGSYLDNKVKEKLVKLSSQKF